MHCQYPQSGPVCSKPSHARQPSSNAPDEADTPFASVLQQKRSRAARMARIAKSADNSSQSNASNNAPEQTATTQPTQARRNQRNPTPLQRLLMATTPKPPCNNCCPGCNPCKAKARTHRKRRLLHSRQSITCSQQRKRLPKQPQPSRHSRSTPSLMPVRVPRPMLLN